MELKKTQILVVVVLIELAVIIAGVVYASTKSDKLFYKEKPTVLLIDIKGELISTIFPGLYDEAINRSKIPVSSTEIVKALQHFEDEDYIKGFILEIDSNGGQDIAEQEIVMQIYRMDKPVVAVIRDQALSSGYYVAAGTRKIYANTLSNVGDVGVVKILGYINRKTGLEGECQIPSTKFKNMYLGDCPPMDPDFYLKTMGGLEAEHERMVNEIAYLRNLSVDHMTTLSDGTIFKGIEAVENGLVDEIGDAQNAVEWLEKELGTDLELAYLREMPKEVKGLPQNNLVKFK